MPSSRNRVSVGVWAKPPKVSGTPKPASSMRMMRMLGASCGRRSGSTRRLWTDSWSVGPALLADGVDGNGSTEPSSGVAAKAGSESNAIDRDRIVFMERRDVIRKPRSVLRQRRFLVRQAAVIDVEVWIEDRLALFSDEGRLSLDPLAGLLLFGVSEQARLQITSDVRMLVGHIGGFAWVFSQVEQLGLARQQGDLDQLPVAFADRAAEGFNVDQDVLMRRRLPVGQYRPDVLAVHWMIRAAYTAGKGQQSGHNVHHMNRLVHHGGLEFSGPVGEGGHADATFVQTALAAAQFTVKSRSLGRLINAAFLVLALFFALRTASEQAGGRAAVVAREEDERVVADALLIERGNDAAHLVVEAGDHGAIGAALLILDVGVAIQVFLRHLIRCVRRQRGEV